MMSESRESEVNRRTIHSSEQYVQEKNRMTEVEIRQKELIEVKEFEIMQKELLELLPEEFRYFVKHQAWQDGHSAGYQEVLGIVNELTYNLLEPIRQYTVRIIKKSE